MKKNLVSLLPLPFALCLLSFAVDAAVRPTSGKGQSAIQSGTNVRAKVATTGLYSQECYDAFYGCMDQFCIPDNANGGSCTCSDENDKYEKQLADIVKKLDEAENIKTVEVERIRAGAKADIIFNGKREYDEMGNVMSSTANAAEQTKVEKKQNMMAMFGKSLYDMDEDSIKIVADQTGDALYNSAYDICQAQIPASCAKELTFLSQVYSTQIKSDCKAFDNLIVARQKEADAALIEANSDVRAALDASFKEANAFDRGTCMLKFRECMQTEDACGSDWSKCVSVVASENMQNNQAVSTAKTKVETVVQVGIAASAMEILDSKRMICEKVLNQCVAVRDMVWPDFLREAAPSIKVAELNAESKMRQSCLTDISDCIQKACKDDIAGNGTETMDACLARPDMARSFCKVQIDTCERMEPQIWGYVKDKLAAMRIDACTTEVRECFTSEDRCGTDFSNCIGMDYKYIHDICPLDKLVVCKKANPNFKMSDLDSMLMGIYLNVDNSMLDNCQNKVDAKMNEICGSTTDCNKFASDDTIGTNSLRSQKDGSIYRITGMISFGSITMGDASGKTIDKGDEKSVKLGPGEIGVQEYLATVRERNKDVANLDGIMSSIEEELNHIAGTINRTIELIESDPEIQYCISGRNLSQITGKNESTKGRFPNLLNQVKMQIAASALRQANDNYNAKLSAEISQATKDASADLAQYMCQKMAETGNAAGISTLADTPLTPPFAVSYDVGLGLTIDELKQGGSGVLNSGGMSFKNGSTKLDGGGMTKMTNAMFNRETRNCHICTTTSVTNCEVKGGNWFRKANSNCKTEAPIEKCEDIAM